MTQEAPLVNLVRLAGMTTDQVLSVFYPWLASLVVGVLRSATTSSLCSSLEKNRVFTARATTHVSPISVILFTGIKQLYPGDLREEDSNLTFMIQADEIGYHVPSEPRQLAFPEYVSLYCFLVSSRRSYDP